MMTKNKFFTFFISFLPISFAIFSLSFSVVIFFTSPTKSWAQSQEKNTPSNKSPTQINATDPEIQSPNIDDSEATESARFANYAVVQALNKTTAKTSILELKVGEKFTFGSIKIIPHKCWQSPPEQKPENKILLEIFESKNETNDKIIEKRIFYGWMFSSSPSISGLEHPIYDLIAINCKLK